MKSKLLISILFFCICSFLSNASSVILPTDPNIQYIGRFDKTDPLTPKMAWTGCEIIARFQGTSLKMQLTSWAITSCNITIDGVSTVLTLQNSGVNVTYSLCTGLADAIHTVKIFKRDSPWQTQNFKGFILDEGKTLVTPPDRKIRKIEFYGDSQTQGAQVDVPGFNTDLGPGIYDNSYNSYAAITARALNAEFTCVAKNGATLTPYPTKDNIPAIYDRIGVDATTPLWDFSSWLGDVVCVNLGVNDSPYPATFAASYVGFVQKIRMQNPNAYIFLFAGPLWTSTTLQNDIAAAVATLNANGDSKVYYFAFKTSINHNGHPRTAENVACAKELVAKIQSVVWTETLPNLSVENVYITPIPLPMLTSSSQQLSATIIPFDAGDKVISWSSSNESVLTVNARGNVTAVGSGTATIIATSHDGNKTCSVPITVTEPIMTNLLLNTDFESPLTTGWYNDWGNTRLNSTSHRSGLYSLEIGPNPGGRSQTINGGFVVGGTYTLSAWGMVLSGSAGSYVGVKCKDIAGVQIGSFVSDGFKSTTNYEQKTVTFKIPANTVSLDVYGYFYATNSSLSLDDFELIYGSKPTSLHTPTETSHSVKYYPNPLTGKSLHVYAKGMIGDKIISISDITGKLIFTQKLQDLENQTVDVKEVGLKGLYIARITNSQYSSSQLLIIQ